MFRRRNRDTSTGSPVAVFEDLRSNALAAVQVGVSPHDARTYVAGVVVDIPAEGGFATVVALADNTTSMYTSVGGGIIGAGEHRFVAEATRRLLTEVESRLAMFRTKDDGGLPPPGSVRFHVLTPAGNWYSDVPESCFWDQAPHDLSAVIGATQHVVAAIRQAQPSH